MKLVYNFRFWRKLGLWNFLVPAFLLCFFSTGLSQTTIAIQDFEVVPMTPTWAITAGAGNIATNTGNGDTPSLQRIRGGVQSWQVVNGTATLDLAPVVTTGFSSIVVTVHISGTSLNGINGLDLTDTLGVFTALNGGAFSPTPDITVTGAAADNARWGYNASGVTTAAGTPVTVAGSSGTDVAPIYSTLQITIPNMTASVALRIIALNNAAQEVWNVDDISISGIAPTAASASVTGRIFSKSGRPIFNASVSLVNQSGTIIHTRSNPFGYFGFSGLEVGEFYILQTSGKGYDFPNPISFQLNEDLTGLEIIGSRRR